MPPEIPGFYFDSERGRYFKVASARERPTETYYHEQEIKKRKHNERKKAHGKDLSQRRRETYDKYLFQLADPFEMAFCDRNPMEFLAGMTIEENLLKNTDMYNSNVDSSFGLQPENHEITKSLICGDCSSDSASIVFSTSKKIVRFRKSTSATNAGASTDEVLLNLNDFDNKLENTDDIRYDTIRLEGSKFSPKGLYFHAQRRDTNTHVFALLFENPVHNKIKFLNFKKREYVHDSVCLGLGFTVAVGAGLKLFEWVGNNVKISEFNSKLTPDNKSDILTLSLGKEHDIPNRLYAGYRDGSIVVLPIGRDCKFQYDHLSYYRLKKIRMILSIKCTDIPGLIFASAVLEGCQSILMLDMMSPSRECDIVVLKTSFLNLTKEQEFFDVTPDGHFVLYGSSSAREGKGSFELFSSHFKDNLIFEKQQRKGSFQLIYFPIKSSEKEKIAGLDLANKKIRCTSFGNARSTGKISNLTDFCDKEEQFAEQFTETHYKGSTHRLVLILEDTTQPSEFYLPPMTLVSADIM